MSFLTSQPVKAANIYKKVKQRQALAYHGCEETKKKGKHKTWSNDSESFSLHSFSLVALSCVVAAKPDLSVCYSSFFPLSFPSGFLFLLPFCRYRFPSRLWSCTCGQNDAKAYPPPLHSCTHPLPPPPWMSEQLEQGRARCSVILSFQG